MTYTTVYLKGSGDDMKLVVIHASRFRHALSDFAENVCEWTGHHFCNSFWMHGALNYADKSEKRLLELPITREQAKEAFPNSLWWLVDEEEDDDDESG